MITYRKGDLPKIIVLVVLIIATFFGSYHFLLAPARQQAAPAAAKAAPTKAAAAPVDMALVAPVKATGPLLDQARTAPDPFRPYVIEDVVKGAPTPAAPTVSSAVRKTSASAPAAAPAGPPAPDLRLVGLVSGSHPMAVLSGEDRRYYVRLGESVGDGWRVSRLSTRSVDLSKGAYRCTLLLTRQAPAKDKKPAAVPPLAH